MKRWKICYSIGGNFAGEAIVVAENKTAARKEFFRDGLAFDSKKVKIMCIYPEVKDLD